jgi:WD40 repeat protein
VLLHHTHGALANFGRVLVGLFHGSIFSRVGASTKSGAVHADAVLDNLPDEQQALAETLFRAITERRDGGQDVRQPQRLGDIAQWAGVAVDALIPVVQAFAAPEVSFLHYGRELAGNSVIDLTHEALMRQWGRLQGWLAEEYQRGQNYRRWSARALEYRDGRGSLLSGGDLVRALEWWNPAADEAEEREPRWQPTPHWASRYHALDSAAEVDGARRAQAAFPRGAWEREVAERFELTRQFLCDSRDAERREREAEQRRLQAEAEASERTKKQIAQLLFESQLTHGSLLVRVEDYAEARRVLADSRLLDGDVDIARRHARNLLAGYVESMGGQAEQVYEGAGAALSGGVAASPDGKRLAAAGERATLVLFDADSGRLLRRLEGLSPMKDSFQRIWSVVFDPQGRWLFSGDEDGRVLRWSLPAGDKLGEWKLDTAVMALALSPDGASLAVGGDDGRIRLWSATDGKPLRILEGHSDSIAAPNGLAFSPDGERLASASFDKTARIWAWRKGRLLQTLPGHTDGVKAVAFSPDGKHLATAGADKQVILWDTASGQPIRAWRGHQNIVFGLAFSADGSQLLSAARDNTLRLWDVASGVSRRVYQGHQAGLWAVARQGDRVYSAANDASLRRWRLATPEQWLWQTGGSPQAAAIVPDGRTLALGMENGALRLYSLPDGQLLAEQTKAHGSQALNRIAFSPDGSLLASAGMGGLAKLWRLETVEGKPLLQPLHSLAGHRATVHAVAFSPDGRRLASAGYDGQIGLFEVASGQGRVFPAHEGKVASVAFDGSGGQLLSAGMDDHRLRLWDANDPSRPPQEIAQAGDQLLWASLSPDGRQLATVGRGSNVSLYDLAQPAAAPRRLVGHEQTVYRAIYSPDGRQLATVSSDMTVRLWDLDSQRQLFAQRLPTEFQSPSPLWDFDFRCTAQGECWIAVPLTVGRLALYRLPYE